MRPTGSTAVFLLLATAGLNVSCSGPGAKPISAIEASVLLNRTRISLDSPVEITYTWSVAPHAKKLDQDYHALVHFVDPQGRTLFDDDHLPEPPPSTWEAGNAYTYTRTKFMPVYPYAGRADVRMGLYPATGRGERVQLKGEAAGKNELRVARIELLPPINPLSMMRKGGWQETSASPDSPMLQATWIHKQAVVSFKNPRRDVVVYLEAEPPSRTSETAPVLTVAIKGAGIRFPIERTGSFVKKVRFTAAQLGAEEWVDLKLAMSGGAGGRGRGLFVHHLYIDEAGTLGAIPAATVADATALARTSVADNAPRRQVTTASR